MDIYEIVEKVLSILADFDMDKAIDIICSGDIQTIIKYMD